MSAPAAVMFAKIMIPETGVPETSSAARVSVPRLDVNIVDAAARGASEGLHLALNVGGDADRVRRARQHVRQGGRRARRLARPPRLVDGAPARHAARAARLRDGRPLARRAARRRAARHEDRAERVHRLPDDDQPRRRCCRAKSLRIASFALCGFANFGSLAIVLGGVGSMVPERRKDLARLGLRSIVAGSLATFLTGTIAGLISP